jgi:hypothetical protein
MNQKKLKSEVIAMIEHQAFVPMTPELKAVLNRLSLKSLRVLRTAFIAASDNATQLTHWYHINDQNESPEGE